MALAEAAKGGLVADRWFRPAVAGASLTCGLWPSTWSDGCTSTRPGNTPGLFLEAASRVTDIRLMALAALARATRSCARSKPTGCGTSVAGPNGLRSFPAHLFADRNLRTESRRNLDERAGPGDQRVDRRLHGLCVGAVWQSTAGRNRAFRTNRLSNSLPSARQSRRPAR